MPPSCLKISDYVLYSTVFYVRQKTSFKGQFLHKQSKNAKQIGVFRNIRDEEFWQGSSEKFQKQGDYLHSQGDAEK